MAVKTEGISPKVYLPLAVGLLVGIILLLAGLETEAASVLLAVVGFAGIGVVAPPGTVVPK